MIKVFFFLFIFMTKAFAVPNHIEFVFLSEETRVSLLKLVDPEFYFSAYLADNSDDINCLPMGDEGCFHPQMGFRENTSSKKKKTNEAQKEVQVNNFNSNGVNLVDCKKGSYFDIFCGKSDKTSESQASYEIEIWIDTSSSMRKMDSSQKLEFCHRHRFLNKIADKCSSNKISFSTFDTSIKKISERSMACMNYGLNNTKNIIDWIKRSSAKYLYIITDIDEHNSELSDFIDRIGAKTHGADVKRFISQNLLDLSSDIIKTCSKK